MCTGWPLYVVLHHLCILYIHRYIDSNNPLGNRPNRTLNFCSNVNLFNLRLLIPLIYNNYPESLGRGSLDPCARPCHIPWNQESECRMVSKYLRKAALGELDLPKQGQTVQKSDAKVITQLSANKLRHTHCIASSGQTKFHMVSFITKNYNFSADLYFWIKGCTAHCSLL